ncbi:MAG: hypothetical protein JXA54_08760 [Candidatus Heimdallarchaeota archaeon]|nr:hypothetical protein [Candidatus Heimdallarchaeota archaeon]
MRNKILPILFYIMLFLFNSFSSINTLTINTITPIVKAYNLPGMSWTFILESGLNISTTTNYVWTSSLKVQGREVTANQYTTMLSLGLTERSEYFETIGYYEGTKDSGRTLTDESGTLYFIFFNFNSLASNLEITYTYKITAVEHWAIGLISALLVIIILTICVLVIVKIRQKMIKEAIEAEKSAAQRYLEM